MTRVKWKEKKMEGRKVVNKKQREREITRNYKKKTKEGSERERLQIETVTGINKH